MSHHPGLWSYFDGFPPPFVRLLAKYPGSGMRDMAVADAEIALRANMTITRVREISRTPSWDGITTGEMRRFFSACNFDPTKARDRQRVYQYQRICQIRQSDPFQYLRRSPKWESEFLPLVKMLPTILQSRPALHATTQKSVTRMS
jgi:hypothetical protein